MHLIYGLTLILLGMLALKDTIGARIVPGRALPSSEPYAGCAGLFALFVSIIGLLETLKLMIHHRQSPLVLLVLVWSSSALTMALGAIFGFDLLSKMAGESSRDFMMKIAVWHDMFLRYRTELGIAALILGSMVLIYTLM